MIYPRLSERVIFLNKIKGKAKIGSANLFFIELVIVLLFFSFSAAVILRIFAAADHRQELSDLTENTLICAQSVAEAFSVSGSISNSVEIVFGLENEFADTAEIKLDNNLNPSENGNITLFLTKESSKTTAGVFSQLNISFLNGESEIYSLKCASYTPIEEVETNE